MSWIWFGNLYIFNSFSKVFRVSLRVSLKKKKMASKLLHLGKNLNFEVVWRKWPETNNERMNAWTVYGFLLPLYMQTLNFWKYFSFLFFFFLKIFHFTTLLMSYLKNKINNARKHNKNPINDYPYLTERKKIKKKYKVTSLKSSRNVCMSITNCHEIKWKQLQSQINIRF